MGIAPVTIVWQHPYRWEPVSSSPQMGIVPVTKVWQHPYRWKKCSVQEAAGRSPGGKCASATLTSPLPVESSPTAHLPCAETVHLVHPQMGIVPVTRVWQHPYRWKPVSSSPQMGIVPVTIVWQHPYRWKKYNVQEVAG